MTQGPTDYYETVKEPPVLTSVVKKARRRPSSYKRIAEKRHKLVHNFLVKNFPQCKVEYNGVEGIDHQIIFNDRTVYAETKSCRRIVIGGNIFDPVKPVIHNQYRLGRFKFDLRKLFPYAPFSQHTWLLEHEGWYVFVVGNSILGGIPAKDLPINLTLEKQWIAWSNILSLCYPDWLERFKKDIEELK